MRLKVEFEELKHLGELDFLAVPYDVEEHGVDIYQRSLAGQFGPIAPFEG